MDKIDMEPVMKESINPQAQAALMLSAYWSRPDYAGITSWMDPGYGQKVRELWNICLDEKSSVQIDRLLQAIAVENTDLIAEYERLFVGPAALPCPPYESVWRLDRPVHEQGTVIGQNTEDMKQLYREMGLQVRTGEVELPDHIAIELEALACAWQGAAGGEKAAELLEGHLQIWLPAFCASVMDHSQSDFYRQLAALTWAWIGQFEPALK